MNSFWEPASSFFFGDFCVLKGKGDPASLPPPKEKKVFFKTEEIVLKYFLCGFLYPTSMESMEKLSSKNRWCSRTKFLLHRKKIQFKKSQLKIESIKWHQTWSKKWFDQLWVKSTQNLCKIAATENWLKKNYLTYFELIFLKNFESNQLKFELNRLKTLWTFFFDRKMSEIESKKIKSTQFDLRI